MAFDDDPAEWRDEPGDLGVVRRRDGAFVEEVGGVVELDAVEAGEPLPLRREREPDLARDGAGRRRLGDRPAPEIAVEAAERTLGTDQEEGQEALRAGLRPGIRRCFRTALGLDDRARRGERVEAGTLARQRPAAQ